MRWKPGWSMVALLAACGGGASGPEADPEGVDAERLRRDDQGLDLELLAGPAKQQAFPKAATSTITLTLRADVTPPTVEGRQLHASSVAVAGPLAFVSYHVPGETYGGAVDVLDISDPAFPVLVSSRAFVGEDVNAVDSDGTSVFLATSSRSFPFGETAAVRAYALDAGVIDPASGRIVALDSQIATSVRAAGGRLFAVTGATVGQLYELDPASLEIVASRRVDDARDLSLVGSVVAVHRGDRVDLFDATTLSPLNAWPFFRAHDAEARSEVRLVGGKAFLTAGSRGVHVLDAADGTILDTIAVPENNPVGLLPSDVVSNGISVVRDMMFIAQGGGGFHLAFTDRDPSTTASDVLDPYHSLSVVRFADWASSNAVAATDGAIVVANGAVGTRLIEISSLAGTRVTIASPQFGTVPPVPTGPVTLTATVEDAPIRLQRVEFYAGSKKVGEDDTDPFSVQVSNLGGDHHDFKARAVFEGGYAKDSDVRRLEHAGFRARISFGETQNAESLLTVPLGFYEAQGDLPAGYVRDLGEVFGDRGGGLYFGWNSPRDNRMYVGHNKTLPDRRYLECIRMHSNGTQWEIQVPNGTYRVRAVAGYNSWRFSPQTMEVTVEGAPLFQTTTTNEAFYVEAEHPGVIVTDGRLTLTKVSGGNSTCLYLVEVMTVADDLQPPTAPAHVGADLVHANSMILRWDASEDNSAVSHYNVYRDDVVVAQSPGTRAFVQDLDEARATTFRVTAVDLHDNESQPSRPFTVTTSTSGLADARMADAPIVIDAVADEPDWGAADRHPIVRSLAASQVEAATSRADLSGWFKVRWDFVHLYLWVQIEDDVLVTDDMAAGGTTGSNGSDDSIEVYFDLSNDRALGYCADDLQALFGYGSTESGDADLDRDGTSVIFTVAEGHYATAATATGWQLEAALPWALIDPQGRFVPEVGARFGFEIQLQDDDDGGGRDSKVAWAEVDQDGAWTSPQRMATLQLGP